MTWLEDPVAWVSMLPAFALPLLVFAAAAFEYIIPPIWGDVVVLLGFFLAGHGAVSVELIFAAALIGSVIGSIVAYAIGRRYGLAVLRKFLPNLSQEMRTRLRSLLFRFQEPILIGNRFLPVVRGFLLFGAGAIRFHPGRTIAFTTVGAIPYLVLLMTVGQAAAESWDEILGLFREYSWSVTPVVILIVAIWVAIKQMRWRKRQQQQQDS